MAKATVNSNSSTWHTHTHILYHHIAEKVHRSKLRVPIILILNHFIFHILSHYYIAIIPTGRILILLMSLMYFNSKFNGTTFRTKF